jgi:hypothetical protein
MGFCCFLVILYGFVAKLVICRVINCVVHSVSLCFMVTFLGCLRFLVSWVLVKLQSCFGSYDFGN